MRRVVLGGIGRPRDRRQPLLPVDDNYFCRCGDLAQAHLLGGGGPIGRGDSLAENDAQPFVGALGLAC
jgi:hypothetical protein